MFPSALKFDEMKFDIAFVIRYMNLIPRHLVQIIVIIEKRQKKEWYMIMNPFATYYPGTRKKGGC